MSDDYSKVTCPHCGQSIEYPTDSDVTSIHCPTCSKSVYAVAGRQERPRKKETSPNPQLSTAVSAMNGAALRSVLAMCAVVVGVFIAVKLQHLEEIASNAADEAKERVKKGGWEYKTMLQDYPAESPSLVYYSSAHELTLKAEGADGWEAVGITFIGAGRVLTVLKRPVKESSIEERLEMMHRASEMDKKAFDKHIEDIRGK